MLQESLRRRCARTQAQRVHTPERLHRRRRAVLAPVLADRHMHAMLCCAGRTAEDPTGMLQVSDGESLPTPRMQGQVDATADGGVSVSVNGAISAKSPDAHPTDTASGNGAAPHSFVGAAPARICPSQFLSHTSLRC